jgi:hypothetical protein
MCCRSLGRLRQHGVRTSILGGEAGQYVGAIAGSIVGAIAGALLGGIVGTVLGGIFDVFGRLFAGDNGVA